MHTKSGDVIMRFGGDDAATARRLAEALGVGVHDALPVLLRELDQVRFATRQYVDEDLLYKPRYEQLRRDYYDLLERISSHRQEQEKRSRQLLEVFDQMAAGAAKLPKKRKKK